MMVMTTQLSRACMQVVTAKYRRRNKRNAGHLCVHQLQVRTCNAAVCAMLFMYVCVGEVNA